VIHTEAQMEIRIQGDKLIVEIDIADHAIAQAPTSKTGKTKIISTTRGFVRVPNREMQLNLNLIMKG